MAEKNLIPWLGALSPMVFPTQLNSQMCLKQSVPTWLHRIWFGCHTPSWKEQFCSVVTTQPPRSPIQQGCRVTPPVHNSVTFISDWQRLAPPNTWPSNRPVQLKEKHVRYSQHAIYLTTNNVLICTAHLWHKLYRPVFLEKKKKLVVLDS